MCHIPLDSALLRLGMERPIVTGHVHLGLHLMSLVLETIFLGRSVTLADFWGGNALYPEENENFSSSFKKRK